MVKMCEHSSFIIYQHSFVENFPEHHGGLCVIFTYSRYEAKEITAMYVSVLSEPTLLMLLNSPHVYATCLLPDDELPAQYCHFSSISLVNKS